MTSHSVRVNLGPRSYDIAIASGDSGGFVTFLRHSCNAGRVLVVFDVNVEQHAQALTAALRTGGFDPVLVPQVFDEAKKSLATVSSLYDRFASIPADRKTPIIAVGGGVCGDVVGFAAATYARGLPLVMAPTTLLAMVDSSVGGKTGVNHATAKNLIGAFHQPIGVWIDIKTLSTLPGREFRSGLAEVVKYGVILDAEFFEYLERNATAILEREDVVLRHVISRCCRLKADIVEKDEREETGLRSILNYGHTFAHAFETVAGYGAWLHGEAVAAGMMCASRLAERRGLICQDVTERQRDLLRKFSLPVAPEPWPGEKLLEAMKKDKKAQADRLRFVLPIRLGEVALFDDVSESEVRAVLT